MTKWFRVKLLDGHTAEPEQIFNGYLSAFGTDAQLYDLKEANKKARMFKGEIEQALPLEQKPHPMNKQRADWSKSALEIFTKETFAGDEPDDMHPEDLENAVQDLICDLLHYANQNIITGQTPAQVHARALSMYEEELAEPDA